MLPITTLARAMRRLGLNRLRNHDPTPQVQRYQWEQPVDIIHVDINQLARFNRVGHRASGCPTTIRLMGALHRCQSYWHKVVASMPGANGGHAERCRERLA
jgi:hypothetical protein